MIREFHLADWFTLGNAVCGVGALFSCMTYLETHDLRHIYFACTLVLAALVFDVLDGRIARWRQKSSAMGRELDSLADVISFGVAPPSASRPNTTCSSTRAACTPGARRPAASPTGTTWPAAPCWSTRA